METMDALETIPDGARASPAAGRNAAPIRDVLKRWLPETGRVLEIAAGTGQHAVAFAAAFPGLDWIPSDPDAEARASIAAWSRAADLPNLHPPLALDVRDEAAWPTEAVMAMLCINMVHISPWKATQAMLRGAERMVVSGGVLVLYGPFLEAGVPLASSNADFDASLKARNSAWGLRDRDVVTALAREHGFQFEEREAMPANNIMLLFRRT